MSGHDRSHGAWKLPKIFGEVSAVLSEPGLGQGFGKASVIFEVP